MGRALQWSPMKPESWFGWFPLKSSQTCSYHWLHCDFQNVLRNHRNRTNRTQRANWSVFPYSSVDILWRTQYRTPIALLENAVLCCTLFTKPYHSNDEAVLLRVCVAMWMLLHNSEHLQISTVADRLSMFTTCGRIPWKAPTYANLDCISKYTITYRVVSAVTLVPTLEVLWPTTNCDASNCRPETLDYLLAWMVLVLQSLVLLHYRIIWILWTVLWGNIIFCVCTFPLNLQSVPIHSVNIVRSYAEPCRRVFTSTLLYFIGSESSCDLGNVTCKWNLKKHIYNYSMYMLNLVGRSIGECFRNRLVSGGSLRFKISSFGCTLMRLLCWWL
jgi:hypothetical protein